MFRQRGPPNTNPIPFEDRLTEDQVIDGFHSFLSSALAQAKAERLLDADTLASAEADLMICGHSSPFDSLKAPALNIQ